MGTKEELLDLERRWMDAVRRNDFEELERLLAPEYALLSRLGVMPREEWLAAAREYEIEDFHFDASEVRLYGEVALVRTRYWQRATLRGQSLTGRFLVTDVWVHGEGGWRVVSRHSTLTEAET